MSRPFGTFRLAARGFSHYRREHLLVAAATAAAVAVLVGALVVGDSVRGSLRAAFTERLGAADFAVLPTYSFSDVPGTGLPTRLAAHPDYRRRFLDPAPVFRLAGTVFAPDGSPAAATVFGVDERFFAFHDLSGAIAPGTARISSGLRGLGIGAGDSLLVRVGEHAAIAAASFYGDKDDAAVTFRRTVEEWPDPAPGPASGDFSLFPGQGAARAVFVPLDELRDLLAEPERANVLLLRRRPPTTDGAAALAAALAAASSLDDRGLSLREAASGGLVLESRSLVLSDAVVAGALAAAGNLAVPAGPTLTYLATSIRAGDRAEGRETPYSLVSGLPPALLPHPGDELLFPGRWLAEDLALAEGDPIEVSFLVWEDDGGFRPASASFRAGPPAGPGGVFADPTLAPEFPGVSDSASMGDWDPPFPVDLTRIRERDERYWEEYRTLPKAFVRYEAARRLWAMRQGSATSVRLAAPMSRPSLIEALAAALPAEDFGLAPVPVREQGLEAARGATDFGAYFLYFSYFLLVSAFVLLALLYRLGIERRLREVGLLLACGWPPRRVTRALLLETGGVAFAGSVAGAFAGLLYAGGMIGLLSGVWEGAVAGTLSGVAGGGDSGGGAAAAPLRVFAGWRSVAAGSFGGLVMALLAAWFTTRRLMRRPPRLLLAGGLGVESAPELLTEPAGVPGRAARRLSVASGVGGLVLLGLAGTGALPAAGGFFGAGAALLTGALLLAWARLRRMADPARRGRAPAWRGLRGLAFRAAAFRPGRSLAAMALVASAAFTLVAVESFRKRPEPGRLPPGAGGFLAVTETVFGAPWDPKDAAGRDALNLPADLRGFRIRALRLAGEEDASCLNLYRPARPRVVGVPRELAEENRFPFAAQLGAAPDEVGNPWRLLWRERGPEEPIPVIGDQNSMTYVLKWPVGEEREFPIGKAGAPVRLRLVGTLWDSLFQGELLMAEEDLLANLPSDDGYRMFLLDREEPPRGPEALAAAEATAAALLDGALSDYGAVSTPARARLAEFHRVENTYLSTFQALGGLGLLLGTLGLGVVLFRNADERRQEWALLAASGYRRRDFAALGFWENALLLIAGLGAGAGAALLAILPVLGQREPGGSSLTLLVLLLLGILAFGLLAGAVAARLAASRPLLASLRAG